MDFKKLSAGKNPEQGEVNVLVEIPKDSSIKYEIDEKSGAIFVDRFLYTAMSYPFNYGSIPSTLAEDGDPTDVLVLSEQAVLPGVVIPSVIIGMLEMEDEAGIDMKLLAVPTLKVDPLFGTWKDITDVPEATKNKLRHFFENYKTLEKDKWVKIKEWRGKDVAIEAVRKSLKSH